jgi:hypothetical protein
MKTTRLIPGLAVTACVLATLMGCHSGTPAAPEGTEIPVSCEFLTRDVNTGDFEALIKAVVIDEASDVPQVGVGVYFRVKSGPGEMDDEGPIRTDGSGRAESVLIGRGATSGNKVTVEVSSGPVTSEIQLDVLGCFSSTAVPPVLSYARTPTGQVSVTQTVTIDLSASTDSDCPGGKPDSWEVNWGEGTPDRGTFVDANSAKPTHDYTDSLVPTTPADATVTKSVTIKITDCQGLTKTATESITLKR